MSTQKAAKRGMGRGLDAILSVSSANQAEADEELRELPVELISPNSKQPRRHFDEDALNALAGSLGERGVLQPVLVRPRPGGRYELVAGERRWRAAQIAGMDKIPALVRPRDDALALEIALIENMAREDLNPIEEANACMALVEELGLTREQVGRRVGRSRVAVSNLLRLLELPDEVLGLIESGTLSEGHGRALLTAKDHGVRRQLARSSAAEGWSVRVLEDRARRSNEAVGAGGREAPDGATRKGKGKAHPDQEAAAAEIAEALSLALGADVAARVAPGGGYRVELAFGSREEALGLARRVRSGA
ncbi:MAG TPA: ParB/RepB/Spo0J family partition protein [Solirubrobacteraceae bacterium]|jgi:ParB family chromosome partitioning protein